MSPASSIVRYIYIYNNNKKCQFQQCNKFKFNWTNLTGDKIAFNKTILSGRLHRIPIFDSGVIEVSKSK